VDPFLRQDAVGVFRHAKYSDAGPVNVGGRGARLPGSLRQIHAFSAP
jgi:hypothetical protein